MLSRASRSIPHLATIALSTGATMMIQLTFWNWIKARISLSLPSHTDTRQQFHLRPTERNHRATGPLVDCGLNCSAGGNARCWPFGKPRLSPPLSASCWSWAPALHFIFVRGLLYLMYDANTDFTIGPFFAEANINCLCGPSVCVFFIPYKPV